MRSGETVVVCECGCVRPHNRPHGWRYERRDTLDLSDLDGYTLTRTCTCPEYQWKRHPLGVMEKVTSSPNPACPHHGPDARA